MINKAELRLPKDDSGEDERAGDYNRWKRKYCKKNN